MLNESRISVVLIGFDEFFRKRLSPHLLRESLMVVAKRNELDSEPSLTSRQHRVPHVGLPVVRWTADDPYVHDVSPRRKTPVPVKARMRAKNPIAGVFVAKDLQIGDGCCGGEKKLVDAAG